MEKFDLEYGMYRMMAWFEKRLGEQLPQLEFVKIPQKVVDKIPILRYVDSWANIGIIPAELPIEVYNEALIRIFKEKGIGIKGEELEKIIDEDATETAEGQRRAYSEALKFSQQFSVNTLIIMPSFDAVSEGKKFSLIAHEGTRILQQRKGLGKYFMSREGLAMAVQTAYNLEHGVGPLTVKEKARRLKGLRESEEFRNYFLMREIGLLEVTKTLGLASTKELAQADLHNLLKEETLKAVERGVAYVVYKEELT